MNTDEADRKPVDTTAKQLEQGTFFQSIEVSTAVVTDTILDKVAH